MANKPNGKNVRDYINFRIPGQLPLLTFKVPKELKEVLKSDLNETSSNSELCRNYIRCINSFQEAKKIESTDYLVLFKLFLYIEDFVVQENVKKHTMYSYQLQKCTDIISITVPTLDENDPFLSVYDEVHLEIADSKSLQYGRNYKGTVIDITRKTIIVRLWNMKQSTNLSNQIVNVMFHVLNWPQRCCHYALHIVSKYEIVDLLYPKLKPDNLLLYKESDLTWFHKNVGNNRQQRQAVVNIISSSAYPAPYILFGPPGTGKTTTLVEAICQIWAMDKTKRILVCASSNAAADEIAKRLLILIPHKHVFRMYAPSKNWQTINEEINLSSNFVEDAAIFLPRELFFSKKIVILTLVSCIRLVPLNLRSNYFSHVFIDEASQAVEPEVLIPLSLTCSRDMENKGILCAQIVISGDPFQLGPVVRSKLIEHLYGISMLERLMDCEPYRKVNGAYNPRYISKLLLNYRSSEPILKISNTLFYDDELVCSNRPSADKLLSNWPEVKNKSFPIFFFDVQGKEARTQNKSVYNEKEAIVVADCVTKLLRRCRNVKAKDIGIVTPFKQQEKIISRRLHGHLTDITVGTVETFQGQERNIIILSAVRSEIFNHDGYEHVGFLSNPKRFNVAITRAKRLLIVIGNAPVICISKCWDMLWKYCESNDACIHVTEDFFNNKETKKT